MKRKNIGSLVSVESIKKVGALFVGTHLFQQFSQNLSIISTNNLLPIDTNSKDESEIRFGANFDKKYQVGFTIDPENTLDNSFFEVGRYDCANCGNKLFTSANRYKANLFEPAPKNVIEFKKSAQYMLRVQFQEPDKDTLIIETMCRQCSLVLGIIIPKGPKGDGWSKHRINPKLLKFSKEDSTDNP